MPTETTPDEWEALNKSQDERYRKMAGPETTPDAEYRKSAEELITSACYMVDQKLGRHLREHWQKEFKKQLSVHESRFPRE